MVHLAPILRSTALGLCLITTVVAEEKKETKAEASSAIVPRAIALHWLTVAGEPPTDITVRVTENTTPRLFVKGLDAKAVLTWQILDTAGVPAVPSDTLDKASGNEVQFKAPAAPMTVNVKVTQGKDSVTYMLQSVPLPKKETDLSASALRWPEANRSEDEKPKEGRKKESKKVLSSVQALFGTEYSNLWREKAEDGFFSNQKNLFQLETDHRYRAPDLGEQEACWFTQTRIGVHGAFGYKAKEDGTSPQGTDFDTIAKATQQFRAAVRFGRLWKLGEQSALGLMASCDVASYPTLDGKNSADRIRTISQFGIRSEFGQVGGQNISTQAEVLYGLDPIFASPNRLVLRGRTTFHNLMGDHLTLFIEGEVNKSMGDTTNPGRVDKDVASMRLGIHLNLLEVFKGFGGAFKASPEKAK